MLDKFLNNQKKIYRKNKINDEKLTLNKRVSRLAVIQAVYMLNMQKMHTKQKNLFVDEKFEEAQSEIFCRNVIYIYKNYIFKKTYQQQMVKGKYIDESFLFNMTKHISIHIDQLNSIISKNLSKQWNINNIDVLLKSILQTAITESIMFSFISKKIIISEYTALTNRFFGNKQSAFINAILDKYFNLQAIRVNSDKL